MLKRPRSLVGRLATIYFALTFAALAIVVAFVYVALGITTGRERDRVLLEHAEAVAKSVRYDPFRGPGWVHHELNENRPKGMRVEMLDGNRVSLGGAGKGPQMAPPKGEAKDGACGFQGAWRVCGRERGEYLFLVGMSDGVGDDLFRLFIWVLVGVVTFSGFVSVLLSRSMARGALAPLSAMAQRIASLVPGAGARVELKTGFRELDGLSARFDELLSRVDDTLARERRFAAEASHELKNPADGASRGIGSASG